ncbi:MAG: choice-of-anchor J domain-containing protein [Gemmataceae bacterium]
MTMYTRLPALAFVLFAGAPAIAQPIQLNEDFTVGNNSIAQLQSRGWILQNNSDSPNPSGAWGPGASLFNPPPSGPNGSYWASDFTTTGADPGNISDWLLTPVLTLRAGVTMSFFTRSGGEFPDRLQVRLSTAGTSSNVGATPTGVGDFTTLKLDINPTMAPGGSAGYPLIWTQFSVTLSVGEVPTPTTGRFGFRYFVPGSSAVNGPADVIGLDSVIVTVPEPTSLTLVGLAIGVGIVRRRSRS